VAGTIPISCSDASIHIALHNQPLDSALRVAVKDSRVVRCLSILSTCDHNRWSASLYFDASPPHHDLHNKHSILLAGALGALYLLNIVIRGVLFQFLFQVRLSFSRSFVLPPHSLPPR